MNDVLRGPRGREGTGDRPAPAAGPPAVRARRSNQFAEIYNAQTGAVDGGWQTGGHWGAAPDQTWSATAYLRMIHNGLFGMTFTPGGITFQPTLPAGWGDATLTGIAYRGAKFTVALHGSGTTVAAFRLDGANTAGNSVPATLTGTHTVDITLTGGQSAQGTGTVLSAVNSGKCVDVNGNASVDGTAVQLWDCNNTTAQNWTRQPDGTVRANGSCLDVNGAGTADGTLVQLWTCNGGGNQQWTVVNGTLVNPASGKCLDDPGYSTTNGVRLDLWTCDNGSNQHWAVP
jgi:hypothetical protein